MVFGLPSLFGGVQNFFGAVTKTLGGAIETIHRNPVVSAVQDVVTRVPQGFGMIVSDLTRYGQVKVNPLEIFRAPIRGSVQSTNLETGQRTETILTPQQRTIIGALDVGVVAGAVATGGLGLSALGGAAASGSVLSKVPSILERTAPSVSSLVGEVPLSDVASNLLDSRGENVRSDLLSQDLGSSSDQFVPEESNMFADEQESIDSGEYSLEDGDYGDGDDGL